MSVEHFIETTIASDISEVSFTINPYEILQEKELTTPTNKLLGNIHTRFSFTQDISTESDGLDVQLMNLDADSVNLISTLAESKPRIIIKAGYKDSDLWTFVNANVIEVKTFWEGTNKVTKLQGKQGTGIDLSNAYQITVKEAKNIKAIQILRRLFDDESEERTLLDTSNKLYLLQELEASSEYAKVLEKYATTKNLSYNFNALSRLLDTDFVDMLTKLRMKTDNPNEIIANLNYNTGLLSPPLPSGKGITFKSLLRPNVFPGKKVVILDNIYLITKTSTSADNEGGDWTIEGEAISTDIDINEVNFV